MDVTLVLEATGEEGQYILTNLVKRAYGNLDSNSPHILEVQVVVYYSII